MRLSLLALALVACGPPSWPEVAYPSDADTVRFAVVPADPIEGEALSLILPMQTDGACHAFDGAIRSEGIAGETQLSLEGATAGMCPIVEAAGSGSSVPLAALGTGTYVVHAFALTLHFDVRPASTSPGPPPRDWEIAHAVAVRNAAPSSCPESYETTSLPPWRTRAPRLFHQVSAAHPDWSEIQVEGAMCAAQSVQLRTISDHEVRYRHSSSSLCHTSESIGTVHVAADGTFTIDPPYVIDGHDVPC